MESTQVLNHVMGVCAEEAEVLWGRWEHVDAALRRPEATALAVGPAGLQWHPGFQGVSAQRNSG